MKKLASAVLMALLGICLHADLSWGSGKYLGGNGLLQYCNSDGLEYGECVGYLMGVADDAACGGTGVNGYMADGTV